MPFRSCTSVQALPAPPRPALTLGSWPDGWGQAVPPDHSAPALPQACFTPPAPHRRRPAPPFPERIRAKPPSSRGPSMRLALPRPRTKPRVHLPGAAVLQLWQDGHINVFLRLLLGESLREKQGPGETPVTLPAPPLLSPDAQLGLLSPQRPSAQMPGPTPGPGVFSRAPRKGVFPALHDAGDVYISFRDPHQLPPHLRWASSGHREAALLPGPQARTGPNPQGLLSMGTSMVRCKGSTICQTARVRTSMPTSRPTVAYSFQGSRVWVDTEHRQVGEPSEPREPRTYGPR